MKTLILTSLLLAGQTGPTWNVEERAVPSPIPSNICVEVHWTEKSDSWKNGKAWTVVNPPIDPETLVALNKVRHQGKAYLKHCSSGSS